MKPTVIKQILDSPKLYPVIGLVLGLVSLLHPLAHFWIDHVNPFTSLNWYVGVGVVSVNAWILFIRSPAPDNAER